MQATVAADEGLREGQQGDDLRDGEMVEVGSAIDGGYDGCGRGSRCNGPGGLRTGGRY
jgi:hypothetical protein